MLAFHSSAPVTMRSDSSGASLPSHASDAAQWSRRGMAYWPAQSLGAFLLRMAAHGQCVSAAMMLGDRRYAAQQLERAWTMREDTQLRRLADELAPYFAGRSPFAGRHQN